MKKIRFMFKKISSPTWVGIFGLIFALTAIFFSSKILYSRTVDLLTDNLRERLLTISVTAAANVNADDLSSLKSEEDWQKPEWAHVVHTLHNSKYSNQDVVYMYIFRKNAANPNMMEFVADADSINPYANSGTDPSKFVDVNRDGKVEPDGPDKLQWPGQPYPEATDIPETVAAYNGPITTKDLYTDSYGTVLTGYAPIKDATGKVVAILGTDIKANDFFTITTITLRPFQIFIALLTAIISILTLIIIYTARKYESFLESSKEQTEQLAESLQKASQTMYGHSHELAISNKTQAFIGQLYKISTLTLTQKQLAEQVAIALQAEFDFEMVGIYQYTKETDTLAPLAIMSSDRVTGIATTAFEAVQFDLVSNHSFFSTLIVRETMHYTENLSDIWQQPAIAETCEKIETEKYVRSSLGYPLIIGQQVIGVVVISLNRTYNDLIEYERDSMQNFMNVISITLNRVTLYEELELANKRQENLIHFVTHEVKGYLTKSQAAFASISEGDFKNIPDSLTLLATRALAETRKGVETVTNILEASNLKKGTTQYIEEAFDFKTIVTEAVASFTPIATEKGLTLDAHISDEAYPFTGDQTKLSRHLIRNLIDNAIKYTPAGNIHVTLEQTATDYLFTVQDTGVGIDAEDIGKLFVEGGRAKDSVKVNVDSTGYGLFIAKMITDAHKGTIWVTSEGRGLGSTFHVVLPRVR